VPLTIILSLVSLVLVVGDIPFLELPCPCDTNQHDRMVKVYHKLTGGGYLSRNIKNIEGQDAMSRRLITVAKIE
jgi:hypothetical protein